MPTRPPAVSRTTGSTKSGAQEIERWHNPFSMLSQEESGKIFNRPREIQNAHESCLALERVRGSHGPLGEER